MDDFLLMITLLIWIPLIPLRFLIQIGIRTWRKMGDFSYLLFFIYWAVVDILILSQKNQLLAVRTSPPAGGVFFGSLFLLLALASGYWTAQTLGLMAFTTRSQVLPEKASAGLIMTGPYRFLRHPFYFTEWFLLSGLSLVTGSWLIAGLLVIAILADPIVTRYEEKELLERFGSAYRDYQKKVPRLLPTFASLFRRGGS